jgi:hypothetical protein
MAFVRVPDPNLDPDKPVRSADAKQIRDNQDDHESRIVGVEDASIRVFSHFALFQGIDSGAPGYPAYPTSSLVSATTYVNYQGSDFTLHAAGNLTQLLPSAAADTHYLRWASGVSQCIANLNFNFANRTKPITFRWRFRVSDVTNAFFLGLTVLPAAGANTVPTDGIYLFLGGAANTFRFRSTSSVTGLSTTGADIAFAVNTWYDIKIVFTNTPGDQAECYVDNMVTPVETFTTDLPTTITMCGRWTAALGAGDTTDIDRALVQAAGTLTDVP